jgi:integrase
MKGYVRKRGNKWSYTVDIGNDPITGKRKQKSKSGFNSPKEAEKALNEVIYEVNKGIYIEPQKMLLRDFALEWFDMYKHRLRDTTVPNYKSNIDKWILPFLGHYKLQDLKPIHAQKFTNHLLSHLKDSAAQKVYTITKQILNHAVNLEILNKNPFQNITIPRKNKKEVVTWSFDELNQFLNTVKKYDELYFGIFAVAAFTGLRKGEVLGLNRFNCDLDNQIITIDKSVAETKQKGVYLDRVKTPSSNRKVAIDDFVVSILKQQIAKNNWYQKKLGKKM